jgi:uncharacterized coiled-coil protein SlyX
MPGSIGRLLCSSFLDSELTRRFLSLLSSLLERGLFEPEQGEGQMWGQRNSKYAVAIGTQLLAKIHVLDNKIGRVDRQQNHLVDRLDGRIDFVGEATDQVGKVVDELNSCIDIQDVQIQQLANMVNNLVGKVEGQAKAIKSLKESQEEQRKVINRMTAKVIALEQYTEDIQKKVFPKVRRSRATWLFVIAAFFFPTFSAQLPTFSTLYFPLSSHESHTKITKQQRTCYDCFF